MQLWPDLYALLLLLIIIITILPGCGGLELECGQAAGTGSELEVQLLTFLPGGLILL